jgi:hypothetical protein
LIPTAPLPEDDDDLQQLKLLLLEIIPDKTLVVIDIVASK